MYEKRLVPVLSDNDDTCYVYGVLSIYEKMILMSFLGNKDTLFLCEWKTPNSMFDLHGLFVC